MQVGDVSSSWGWGVVFVLMAAMGGAAFVMVRRARSGSSDVVSRVLRSVLPEALVARTAQHRNTPPRDASEADTLLHHTDGDQVGDASGWDWDDEGDGEWATVQAAPEPVSGGVDTPSAVAVPTATAAAVAAALSAEPDGWEVDAELGLDDSWAAPEPAAEVPSSTGTAFQQPVEPAGGGADGVAGQAPGAAAVKLEGVADDEFDGWDDDW